MCGCGALRGEILNSARLGVISIKYGDNRPPGFWEVYFRQDATGFTIERLTEELRRGEVLVGGRFPTKHFYLLNQASLYKRSAYHLLRLLRQLSPAMEVVQNPNEGG
jgi:hypothetical protein